MTKPRFITIGKSSQDVFLLSDKEFKPFVHKGVKYERLPLGSKIHVDDMIVSTGGNATNAAVTFARQGLHCVYLWTLGTDLMSQGILAALDEENVDTSRIVQQAHWRPSYSTILLSNTGERTVLNFPGSLPKEHDVPFRLGDIAEADWMYLSSVNNMVLLEKIISHAKKAGIKIMMNPSGLELEHPGKLRALLDDIEVVVMNKEEAELLVEGSTLEELVRHLNHYCPVAIVSDGPKGVMASDGKTIIKAGMYEDVKVVDRLGAGDAFGSGFLSQWAQGKSLAESITFASANSTSVVASIGAKTGILHHGVTLHDMPLDEKQF